MRISSQIKCGIKAKPRGCDFLPNECSTWSAVGTKIGFGISAPEAEGFLPQRLRDFCPHHELCGAFIGQNVTPMWIRYTMTQSGII